MTPEGDDDPLVDDVCHIDIGDTYPEPPRDFGTKLAWRSSCHRPRDSNARSVAYEALSHVWGKQLRGDHPMSMLDGTTLLLT